jgi:hypothetical protein
MFHFSEREDARYVEHDCPLPLAAYFHRFYSRKCLNINFPIHFDPTEDDYSTY